MYPVTTGTWIILLPPRFHTPSIRKYLLHLVALDSVLKYRKTEKNYSGSYWAHVSIPQKIQNTWFQDCWHPLPNLTKSTLSWGRLGGSLPSFAVRTARPFLHAEDVASPRDGCEPPGRLREKLQNAGKPCGLTWVVLRSRKNMKMMKMAIDRSMRKTPLAAGRAWLLCQFEFHEVWTASNVIAIIL